MKNRKEIGSEYWDIPVGKDNIFPKDTLWFLSGRSALTFIVRDIKTKWDVKTAALPFWCCDSMIIPFIKEGIDVLFYNKDIPECDIALTMEYFGFIRNKPIDFGGVLIYDVTHSVFSPNMGIKRVSAKDEYFFGSLRKWAGFKTGGFAGRFEGEFGIKPPCDTDEEYVKLRMRAMAEKEAYIVGEREDKEYLSIFSKAEDMLEEREVFAACDEDVIAARNLDVEFIRKRRRENAKILLNEVADIALFKELKEEDVPLFVPIVLPNEKRNALRKFLIENNVYCPIHWPYTSLHGEKGGIFDTELSLVCDQRYDEEDMKYICSLINEFEKVW